MRIGPFRHRFGHLLYGIYAFSCKLFCHLAEYFRGHLCIIASSVMIEIAETVKINKRIELVILKFGIQKSRHRKRVKIRRIERNSCILRRATNKSHIKICIMCHYRSSTDKLNKCFYRVALRRSIGNHFISNSCKLGYLFGNMPSGICKG